MNGPWFFGWLQQVRTARRDGRIDNAAVVVLLALAAHADYRTGRNARPSIPTLAEEAGVSERTVRRGLAAGLRCGLIVLVRRGGGAADAARASTYRMPVDPAVTGTPATDGRSSPVAASELRPSGVGTPAIWRQNSGHRWPTTESQTESQTSVVKVDREVSSSSTDEEEENISQRRDGRGSAPPGDSDRYQAGLVAIGLAPEEAAPFVSWENQRRRRERVRVLRSLRAVLVADGFDPEMLAGSVTEWRAAAIAREQKTLRHGYEILTYADAWRRLTPCGYDDTFAAYAAAHRRGLSYWDLMHRLEATDWHPITNVGPPAVAWLNDQQPDPAEVDGR